MNRTPHKKVNTHKHCKTHPRWLNVFCFVSYFLPVVAAASPLQDQMDLALNTYIHVLAPATEGQRIEGQWQKLDPRLTLGVCQTPLDIAPFSGKKTGRMTVRVTCQSPVWSMLVPLHVKTFRNVVVSAAPIARDAPISADSIKIEEREIKPPLDSYYSNLAQIQGHIAKRQISIGQVLNGNMLKAPDLISKGQSVIIEAGSDSFAIRVSGTALTEGAMGDIIRVRNSESGRVVEGAVISEGKIRVAL